MQLAIEEDYPDQLDDNSYLNILKFRDEWILKAGCNVITPSWDPNYNDDEAKMTIT
jgi:uncharacterized Fe-S cluster-containing radical SAM superfamily enzyme